MIPRVFRVENGRYGWWMIADGRGVMSSIPGEARSVLVARWHEVYGRHPGGVLDHPETISADEIGDTLDWVRTVALNLAAKGGAA